MGLILDTSDSNEVPRTELARYEPPPYTRSWRPPSYETLVAQVQHRARQAFGLDPVEERYGLARKGKQLFASFAYELEDGDAAKQGRRLALGLRQSYDRSLALGLVAGSSVVVCSNLMFDGDALRVVRKNTTNCWNDFTAVLDEVIGNARAEHQRQSDLVAKLEEADCPLNRGYEIIGLARGLGLVTPEQSSICYHNWTIPRHEAFAERNHWSLYNCFTEAMKKGSAGRRMDRQFAVHGFFANRDPKRGPVIIEA